jgi:hypothetical protein
MPTFIKTTEDAEMAIVGCYDGLKLIYAEGVAFPVASEVLSDNTFGGTGNTDDWVINKLTNLICQDHRQT